MYKIGIIAILIIILIIAVSFFSVLMPLGILDDGEYHTGFSMSDVNNCETIREEYACTSAVGCWYGQVISDYMELIGYPFNNGPIVTSMSRGTGERSMPIVCHGNVVYFGLPQKYWDADYGWYVVDVKYYGGGPWHTIINTKNNQVDEDIVAFIDGSTTKKPYYEVQYDEVLIGKMLPPITFSLKGSHVGILRVRQVTEFVALFGLVKDEHVMSTDYAFMISGKGNVEIVEDRTRYIEGIDTVKFSVDTGYSGYTQGGEYIDRGWELKVYDNYGNMKQMWKIGDDKVNARYDINGNLLDYPVPEGSFNPTGSNTWTVVLTNTLFNQDDETFFAISQEALLQAPDIKTIKFDATQYNLGDSVTVILEGIPNPLGRNSIDGFMVNILYGKDGTDYIGGYHQKYVSGSDNIATITFTPSKGDTYITVEAWAFDIPENQGGIMSEKATGQIYIKDKYREPVDIDFIPLIIAFVIFLIFVIIGFIAPIPGGWLGKIVFILFGVIIACITYLYIL